jgi:hypothetical protein
MQLGCWGIGVGLGFDFGGFSEELIYIYLGRRWKMGSRFCLLQLLLLEYLTPDDCLLELFDFGIRLFDLVEQTALEVPFSFEMLRVQRFRSILILNFE